MQINPDFSDISSVNICPNFINSLDCAETYYICKVMKYHWMANNIIHNDYYNIHREIPKFSIRSLHLAAENAAVVKLLFTVADIAVLSALF